MVELRPLSHADLDVVRGWRNAARESLRTPYPLTPAMQDRFAAEVVDNPQAPHRYFGIWTSAQRFVGMGGLTYIRNEDGIAEISLIVSPSETSKGFGWDAVGALLDEAFGRMRLLTVCGEAYYCNPSGVTFWQRFCHEYGGEVVRLPRRKWWDGRLWDSLYFTITAEAWAARRGEEKQA